MPHIEASEAARKGAPATKDSEFATSAQSLSFSPSAALSAPLTVSAAPLAGSGSVSVLEAPPKPPAAHPALAPSPALLLELPGGQVLNRVLEALPALLTWVLVTAPFWAGLVAPIQYALAVIAFDLFWLYLSASTAYRALRGYARLLHDRGEDWLVRYRAASVFGRARLDWDDIRHIVIIPNYKEPLPTLRRTLDSLAAQDVASQIYVVLAMEAREAGAEAKAEALLNAFDGRFGDLTYTMHPAGLAGEVVGKSSNEAWAARIAKRLYVDERGDDIDNLTVSSCDADTVFHERYFSCLSYKFATNAERYRRFWQSPVLLNNNIWEVPAPLRVGSALSGVNILSNLVKRNRMIFPQSTYSLSLRMADDVGYWDTDVIPEDWHMFLKCFFAFSGGIEVEPIYLPTGNDGVKAGSYGRSLKMAYIQHKRHAWGACDIPYAIRQCMAHSEIPFRRKTRRLVALASNHLIWSTHWSILTLGWLVPLALADVLGVNLLPMWLPTLARILLSLCAAPYVVMIFIDARLRPPKPANWRHRDSVTAFVYWWLLPVTSLIFSTAPALESQTRLMLGKRLEYRVTEKA